MKLPEDMRHKLHFNLTLLGEYKQTADTIGNSSHGNSLHANMVRVGQWLDRDEHNKITTADLEEIRKWLGWN